VESTILINCGFGETRVALLEDGVPAEIYIERQSEVGLVGNIYKGRVTRVLPGMEAAFLDVGLSRAAFLYVDDVWTPTEPEARADLEFAPRDNPSTPPESGQKSRQTGNRREDRPSITRLLQEGQELLVQVSKDPIGTKGARVTAHLTLAGRFAVLMPSHQHVGVSKRITDETERTRLRTLVEDLRQDTEGFIVRTEGQGIGESELHGDIEFLRALWQDIERSASGRPAPSLVQAELDIVLRAARDLFTREVRRFVVDDAEQAERIRELMRKYAPELAERVEVHADAIGLFDHFGVETELERALQREVPLKSGGSIVIDQAEALTAIDINTGSFVGKQNLESTILRTNLEAAKVVVSQIRLRNIGGIIIVDFIDMESEENRALVYKTFCDELERDRAKSHPLPISPLGVLEMTRKRVRDSLGAVLTEPCPYCNGLGRLRSRLTVCHEIFRELTRQSRVAPSADLVVSAHPEVAAMLAEENAETLGSLEKTLGGVILIQARREFHQERYEIHRRGSA
jgi:ribonuclease G